MFHMSVTPGSKFVTLTKDSASAPPNAVTVRLSFAGDEPPQLWRLVFVGCANSTLLCSRPTSAVALADQERRWQITRPAARIDASADLVVSFNASGLPEDLTADAYVTMLGIEVVEQVRSSTLLWCHRSQLATLTAWSASLWVWAAPRTPRGRHSRSGPKGSTPAVLGFRQRRPYRAHIAIFSRSPRAQLAGRNIQVVEASGAVRQVALSVSASVLAEAVANRSSWGAVPPGHACAEADRGEYAAPQARAAGRRDSLLSPGSAPPPLDPSLWPWPSL